MASLKASSRRCAIQWIPRMCMLLPLSLLTTPLRVPVITDAPSVAHATNLACHSSPQTSLIMLSIAWAMFSPSAFSTSCIPTKWTSTLPRLHKRVYSISCSITAVSVDPSDIMERNFAAAIFDWRVFLSAAAMCLINTLACFRFTYVLPVLIPFFSSNL